MQGNVLEKKLENSDCEQGNIFEKSTCILEKPVIMSLRFEKIPCKLWNYWKSKY